MDQQPTRSEPRERLTAMRLLGIRGAVRFYACSFVQPVGVPKAFTLTSPLADHPLACRTGASDLDVFRQVFLDQQYRCIARESAVDWVLDCGANVGYTSAYLLSRYPAARVVAIEPDPDNYAMLVQNLRPYGPRALPVHGAVWSHETTLELSPERSGDGREWARQVRPRAGDGTAVAAWSIPGLLARYGIPRVSILKVDIEGAESVVFRDCAGWIDRMDVIAAELHAASPFGDPNLEIPPALEAHGFTVSHLGELAIFRRAGRAREG